MAFPAAMSSRGDSFVAPFTVSDVILFFLSSMGFTPPIAAIDAGGYFRELRKL
jgi:hypothetical protein